MKTLTICLIVGFVGLTAGARLEPSISSFSAQSQTNELALRKILKELRSKIKQYLVDRKRLPSSLDDLVSAKYLDEIPIDPITGERDWVQEMGSDPKVNEGQGLANVKSNASGKDSTGVAYRDY